MFSRWTHIWSMMKEQLYQFASGGDSVEDVISVRILGQTENCREGGTTFLSLAVIAIFAQPRTFLQFCTAVVMQVGQMTEETVAVVSNRVGDCAPSLGFGGNTYDVCIG